MSSRNFSALRCTGTNRFGPTASPMRSCPSSRRCVSASSTAAPSSSEKNGAFTSGAYPLTNTTGTPLSMRRWYRLWSAVVSACSPDTNTMPDTPRAVSVSMNSSSVAPPGACVHSTERYPRITKVRSITWANAGKIGLSSSGMISPISPALRWRARAGRS